MAKKRIRDADDAQEAQDPCVNKMNEDESGSSDEEMDMVNVDFELFNYNPDIDFHGVKQLLRQLFDVDSALLDLSGLTDLITRQNTIGSTCKVDDGANDAYAFMTVINVREELHGESEEQGRRRLGVEGLCVYLVQKARQTGEERLASAVAELLDIRSGLKQERQQEDDDGVRVGIVLAERLINMPAEVVPPMWRMLVEEVAAAVEDGEPYRFTHFLVVSKVYQEVASDLLDVVYDGGDGGERMKKKAKSGPVGTGGELMYFHPEDEEMARHAVAAGSFTYTKDDEVVADSKRAFQEMGIRSKGLLMLIEADKLEGAIQAVGEFAEGPL